MTSENGLLKHNAVQLSMQHLETTTMLQSKINATNENVQQLQTTLTELKATHEVDSTVQQSFLLTATAQVTSLESELIESNTKHELLQVSIYLQKICSQKTVLLLRRSFVSSQKISSQTKSQNSITNYFSFILHL